VSQAGQARDHFLKISAKAKSQCKSFSFSRNGLSLAVLTLAKVFFSFSRQADLDRLQHGAGPDSPDSPDSPELRVDHQVLICSLFFFCFFLFFFVIFCFFLFFFVFYS
jgi:hypothetical protein